VPRLAFGARYRWRWLQWKRGRGPERSWRGGIGGDFRNLGQRIHHGNHRNDWDDWSNQFLRDVGRYQFHRSVGCHAHWLERIDRTHHKRKRAYDGSERGNLGVRDIRRNQFHWDDGNNQFHRSVGCRAHGLERIDRTRHKRTYDGSERRSLG
jgi:hypothetical protein